MSTRPELETGFDGCGIFEGVPLEIYLQWAGISHHDWWILNKQTPEEYKHRRDHPRALDSDALRRGHAGHTAILEPDKFEERYVVQPATYKAAKGKTKKWSNNAEACRAWRAEQETAGRCVLSADEMAAGLAMAARVRQHKECRRILDHAAKEVSMQWVDQDTGLLVRARLDLWWADEGVVADAKTGRDISPDRFGRDAYNRGYCAQLAFYYDGLLALQPKPLRIPLILAVKSLPPHPVAIYELSYPEGGMPGTGILESARVQYQIFLRIIADCKASGRWPAYPEGHLSLRIPPWAFQEIGLGEAI